MSKHSSGPGTVRRDLTGKRFGMLVVCHRTNRRNSQGSYVFWQCQCDCGNTVEVNRSAFGKSASQHSCGCVKLGRRKRYSVNDVLVRKYPSEFNTWTFMISRCHDERAKDFSRYGGRGIVVCDAWRASFDAFVTSVGPKPGPRYTLDRIDNSKGYEPGNCRWATPLEQGRNKSNNVMLTHNGETLTVSQWAERLEIYHGTLLMRIKAGWSDERIITTPSTVRYKRKYQDQPGIVTAKVD